MNDFNLKKFLIENKITRNSKLFEADDDFEFTDIDKDLAAKLNIKELIVGDYITPDMWDQNKIKEQKLDDWFGKPIQIQWIEDFHFEDGSIEFLVSLEIKDHENWDQDWELDYLNDLLKPEYKIVVPDNLDEQDDDFEFTDIDKNLANQLELENDLKKTFLKLWDEHITDDYLSLINTNNVIYDGLDKVLKDPKLKEKIFNDTHDRIADEDFESEEERYNDFQGSVIDEIDYTIMAEFAPQLARNLLTAGFKYDSDEDMWTSPNTNQFTSYGIIWDVWGVDYDTSVRETISEYLEQAAQELS
jgi:hypothetical protein